MFGVEKSDPKTLSTHKLDGKKLYIGIVQARFNEDITNALAQACQAELEALGVKPNTSTISQYPAHWKYPPHCKLWLKKTPTMR